MGIILIVIIIIIIVLKCFLICANIKYIIFILFLFFIKDIPVEIICSGNAS